MLHLTYRPSKFSDVVGHAAAIAGIRRVLSRRSISGAAVIRHAQYRANPAVRRSRVARLTAQLRGLEPSITAAEPTEHQRRWREHLQHRLEYERALLAEEGGSAADADMIAGGWIQPSGRGAWRLGSQCHGDWFQIQRVNRSPATGRVTSVAVKARTSCDYDRHGKAYGPGNPRPMVDTQVEVERLPESAYRPPTTEDLAAFHAAKKTAKAAAKAAAKPKPPLVNPTPDDAQRLQDIWNAANAARYPDAAPVMPTTMTQAEYTASSRGSYSRCVTVEIDEHGLITRVHRANSSRAHVFSVRIAKSSSLRQAPSVAILIDKPQRPLPWDAVAAAAAAAPKPEDFRGRMHEIQEALAVRWTHDWSPDQRRLLSDAAYANLVRLPHDGGACWTEAGLVMLAADAEPPPEDGATTTAADRFELVG